MHTHKIHCMKAVRVKLCDLSILINAQKGHCVVKEIGRKETSKLRLCLHSFFELFSQHAEHEVGLAMSEPSNKLQRRCEMLVGKTLINVNSD